jgi:hypothetical protein
VEASKRELAQLIVQLQEKEIMISTLNVAV